jgi:hypothetical protein
MTTDIAIGPYKGYRVQSMSWRNAIDEYMSVASLTIPAVSVLDGGQPDVASLRNKIPTQTLIKEGMSVSIRAGYNGNNQLQFEGFVAKIIYKAPMVVQCEGWGYRLRNVITHRLYTNTTVADVLTDLVKETGISLHNSIPHIPLHKADLRNYTGLQVLEWLKRNLLLTIYFEQSILYCGLRYGKPNGQKIDYRVGWNVASDADLIKTDIPLSILNIDIKTRNEEGEVVTTSPAGNNNKVVRITGTADPLFIAALKEDLQTTERSKGMGGKLVVFLSKTCRVNDIANISNRRYPEMAGSYIIDAVDGTFDRTGARQVLTLGRRV